MKHTNKFLLTIQKKERKKPNEHLLAQIYH